MLFFTDDKNAPDSMICITIQLWKEKIMLSAVQFNIPEEIAVRLKPLEDQISEILEFGLRSWNAAGFPEFDGTAEVMELLASLPTPQEVLALRPTETLQHRIEYLLEKNRNEGLTPVEEKEWNRYEYLEHLVRMAKAKACLKLKNMEI